MALFEIKGAVAIVDDEDVESLLVYRWYLTREGYAARRRGRPGELPNMRMHRFIMKADKGVLIDHINGNRLDNRKCNLRFCTPTENARNKKKSVNNKSGFKGVIFVKRLGRYRPSIMFNGKLHYMGSFTTAEAAHAAYVAKAKEFFGEFANGGLM